MKPEDCWKILTQEKKDEKGYGDGKTLLSQLDLTTATMSEALRLPAKGLKYSIINTEAPAALLAWYKAESAGKGSEEEAAVQNLLDLKGDVVKEGSEEMELRPAIQRWNEKNKQLCKYSHLSCLFHMRDPGPNCPESIVHSEKVDSWAPGPNYMPSKK